MPFAAFYAVGHAETFIVPAWCHHLHMIPNPDFTTGVWAQNIAVTPGEKLTVRVGLHATELAGGWPDGGHAGGDLPVAPFTTFHAKGGNGSTAVLRGDRSVLLCVGGNPGPAANLNDNTRGGGVFHVGDPLPSIGEDPRIPDPDAFNIPHYVAPQFPDAGLPLIYQWTPGAPGGAWRGGTGIVATNPEGGAPRIASSGGGGGYGGGASGGYEVLSIHTDPSGDGTGRGGSNLLLNQTYLGRQGGFLIPPSDPMLPTMTSDELAMAELLRVDAQSRAPSGQPGMVAFFWPTGPANGWTVGQIGTKVGDTLASLADAALGFI